MKGDAQSRNAAAFGPTDDDVFARIAGRYDRLCDIFSFGIHRLWKSRMAKAMAYEPGTSILDVASGTGDIPARFLNCIAQDAKKTIMVTDICPQMLARAKDKLGANRDGVSFAVADGYHLSGIAGASRGHRSISIPSHSQ